MHNDYRFRGFEILAFPCDQFNNGDPSDEEKFIKFAHKYKSEFPIMKFCDVNGSKSH